MQNTHSNLQIETKAQQSPKHLNQNTITKKHHNTPTHTTTHHQTQLTTASQPSTHPMTHSNTPPPPNDRPPNPADHLFTTTNHNHRFLFHKRNRRDREWETNSYPWIHRSERDPLRGRDTNRSNRDPLVCKNWHRSDRYKV